MEALFSGRWDQKLQRDADGRIFLDVNPVAFQAIVDYLNELAISSVDDPPDDPTVDEEHTHILGHQLNLFGISDPMAVESNIPNVQEYISTIRNWLQEDGSDGTLALLYQGSRDGMSAASFHSKCDNMGRTLTIIETTTGLVVGGYSNTPWSSEGNWTGASKAFLFAFSGSGISSPSKVKLKGAIQYEYAVFHKCSHGPTFGGGYDLNVTGSSVELWLGNSYETHPGIQRGTYAIKEIEVFGVEDGDESRWLLRRRPVQIPVRSDPITVSTERLNKALNEKQDSLLRAEQSLLHLEQSFKDEHDFIAAFASGDAKDVVALNVSGTMMASKRATLCSAQDSVLAQQFDDSKWTEQGQTPRVKTWTPDDVAAWASNIEGMSGDTASTLKQNGITGPELLALNMEGLQIIGIERAGTRCLLLKEIKALEKVSADIVTLIEHSPYCFSKIIDYLRMSRLHSQGLSEEPGPVKVCDSQKKRYEKVVSYYFPGATSLGEASKKRKRS